MTKQLAVLLVGCPALAGPLRAAGAAVLSSGAEPPEQVARLAEEARKAGRDYAVVLARPTPALAAWAQAQIGQRHTVVFLSGGAEGVAPPPAAQVARLPLTVDDILVALGAKPVGGVAGTALVATDLTVRPTQARPGLGLFGTGAPAPASVASSPAPPPLPAEADRPDEGGFGGPIDEGGADVAPEGPAGTGAPVTGPGPDMGPGASADEGDGFGELAWEADEATGPGFDEDGWQLAVPEASGEPGSGGRDGPAEAATAPAEEGAFPDQGGFGGPVPLGEPTVPDEARQPIEAAPPWLPVPSAEPTSPAWLPPAQAPSGLVTDEVFSRQPHRTAKRVPAPSGRLVTDEVFSRPAPAAGEERVAPLVICFAGKGGVGKCLVSDTVLTDPITGVPRRLDEVVADPDAKRVLTLEDGTVKVAPIAAKVGSGVQPTLRLTLRSGRSITATPSHPLLLTDGWRRLDAVEPGETIAVPARTPHPLAPVPMSLAEIDLLAVLMAEGGLTGGGTLFTSPDPVVVSTVEHATKALGFVSKPVTGKAFAYQVTCHTRPRRPVPPGLCGCGCGKRTELAARTGGPRRFVTGHGNYTDLTVLLRRHGLQGHSSRTKPMPEAIYRLPAHQLARFINVFWGCDGYVTKAGIPELVLANEPLLRSFQHLLLRFGVQSTVRYKKARAKGKDFDAWALRVHAGSVGSFAEHFPLWGEKGARLLARAGVDHNPNLGGPTVTDGAYEGIVSHRHGLGVDDAARLRGWRTGKTSPSMLLLNRKDGKRRTLSLTGLAAYAKAYGLENKYGWIYSDDIFWDEVVSVGPAGRQQVWDLSVDGTHCFIANDIVVHNSTTALALGQQAAAQGLRAFVVDANRGQGDLRKYLRVGQAYLSSVVDAAVSGDPARAFTSPERLVATRPSGLPPLAFGVVLAPTDAQVDPGLVTPDVYRQVVRAARREADIVVVDTQIVEAADTSGMVEQFLVPELLAGAWGLGISDTSVGVDNLLRRLYMLSARGVGPERLMVCLNRVEAQSGLNQEAMARLVEPYAAWMGAVAMDPAVATAFESGGIPTSAELSALLKRILWRVTGVGSAPDSSGRPANRPRWRWLRWGRPRP